MTTDVGHWVSSWVLPAFSPPLTEEGESKETANHWVSSWF
ncbi:hypothetical protein TIFTF001_009355 [Ficus carica]|uniref:Uncharacterized protein n=1 Tax=Ficus carica TaxID=3494 RepID=A0AA87ZTN9_FICCA|nr:hypothetical protein TIFTF001_009355 [Ficus carica]